MSNEGANSWLAVANGSTSYQPAQENQAIEVTEAYSGGQGRTRVLRGYSAEVFATVAT